MNENDIKRFEYEQIPLYKNGKFITMINNDVELAYVQLAICKENVNGYAIVFNGERIPISSDGQLAYWPDGLYDERKKVFTEIALLNMGKRE